MSKTDEQIIAEAISKERKGWPWKSLWQEVDTGETARYVSTPDIGPHNILRVIEWAATQEWWWTILDGADDKFPGYSPGERVGGVLQRFIYDGSELSQVAKGIACIIAHAIRREIDRRETTDGGKEES